VFSIEDLVRKCFTTAATKLDILPEDDLNIAIHNFVEKDDKQAITEYVLSLFTIDRSINISL